MNHEPYDWARADHDRCHSLQAVVTLRTFWAIVDANWTRSEQMTLVSHSTPLYARCDELGTSDPENGDRP